MQTSHFDLQHDAKTWFSLNSPRKAQRNFFGPLNVETHEHVKPVKSTLNVWNQKSCNRKKTYTFCQTIHSCDLRSLCLPSSFLGGKCPTCPKREKRELLLSTSMMQHLGFPAIHMHQTNLRRVQKTFQRMVLNSFPK